MNYSKRIVYTVFIIILMTTAFAYGSDSRDNPVTATYCDKTTMAIYPFSFVTRTDDSVFNCYNVQASAISDGFRYAFEDGTDNDYNDVIVDLWVTGNQAANPVAHIKYISKDASYKHWIYVVYNGSQQLVFKAEDASPGAVFDIPLPSKQCPDYEVKAEPPLRTINQGESTFYTITIKALGGFSNPVNLSVSGLPTGANAIFDINPLPVTGESKLNIATTGNTPVGTYTLTITGAAADKTHTTQTTLEIKTKPAEPDFRINVSPSSRTIEQGESTFYTLTVAALNGFSNPVNLDVTGLPAGASSSFEKNPLPVNGESKLTVTTTSITQAGTYTLVITGAYADKSHKKYITLEIKNKPMDMDFTIDASPSSQAIDQGEIADYTVKIKAVNNFTGAVNLSVSGLPAGASFSFEKNPLPVNSESKLSFSTTSSTPVGTYTLTAAGESNINGVIKKHTASISLTVGCRDFSVHVNASPDKGLAPLTVMFEAVIDITGEFSPDVYKYKWEFGDGGISSEQKPGHMFQSRGSYTVTLVVTDPCGASKTASKTIDVGSVDATLVKSVDKTLAKPGESLEYRLIVKNDSSISLTGVTLTDELSQYLEFVSQDSPLTFSRQGRRLNWGGTIQPYQQATVVIKVKIGFDVFSGTRIQNNATMVVVESKDTFSSNTVETVIAADPIIPTRVYFTKRADTPQTEVGKIIHFNITIRNDSNSTLFNPVMEDYLPQGFSYVAGTAMLDGQRIADPQGNRTSIWSLSNIFPGQTLSIRYQVIIGADAARGKNISKAVLRTRDNSGQDVMVEASAFVNVSSDSFIFYSSVDGTVYLDRDGDEFYSMADTPLPGIEVAMSNGQKVVTDGIGHFAFESLFPGEYVLAVNRATLPEKYRVGQFVPKIVVLSDGLSDTVDFPVKFQGEEEKKTAQLEGRVFYDKNQNKIYDPPGDPLIKEFQAKLDGKELTRGSNGVFIFTLMEPGNHSVEILYDGRTIKKELQLNKGNNSIDIPLPFTGIKIVIRSQQ